MVQNSKEGRGKVMSDKDIGKVGYHVLDIVTQVLKSCICHFEKCQIQLFNTWAADIFVLYSIT